MTARVVAVCVVHAVKPDAGRVGRTAVDKRPVVGPVQVGPRGLAGDVQCDERDHGGPDKAVYVYAEEEALRWAAELCRPIPPGLFGENLTVRDIPTSDAVVGERWRVGDTVELQVTGPRIPCATFARHIQEPRWVRRFAERGDIGAYLRVLTPGTVAAGDAVRRIDVPEHGTTVRDAFAALLGNPRSRERVRLDRAAARDLT